MYTPISCVCTGVQKGRKRFPDSPPLTKHWRCELTALSHIYNLYFVACNDEIWIYEPSFPDQSIGNEPITILKVPVSKTPVPPGIDGQDPHSINRVLVEYLGNSEVLLVCCDDGDVVGYEMEAIHDRILRLQNCREEDHDKAALEDHPINVFQCINVGASAWGLAVHREARLIAISANTHMVKVIVYGLSKGEGEQKSDGESDAGKDFPFPRDETHIITLRARNNIPSVSFDNTGNDPDGRWLTSSDIDGCCLLWDLSQPDQPARIINVGYCALLDGPSRDNVLLRCACRERGNYPHSTWATMFIDPWSCHQVNGIAEACGFGIENEPWYRKGVEDKDGRPFFEEFWDITPSEHKGVRRSHRSPHVWQNAQGGLSHESPFVGIAESGEEATEGEEEDGSEEEEIEEEEDVEEHPDSDSQGSGHMSINQFNNADAYDETEEDLIAQEDAYLDQEEALGALWEAQQGEAAAQSHPDDENSLFVPDATAQPHAASAQDESSSSEDYGEDDVFVSEDEMADVIGRPIFPRKKRHFIINRTPATYQPQGDSLQDLTPSTHRPALIITRTEIYLFQSLTSPSPPILALRNPLFPPHTPAITPMQKHYHRHSFAAQIPELGVFVVGSPAGRVGVFRVTRTRFATPTRRCGWVCGMRGECVLPRTEEELRDGEGFGGGRLLVGVAVGPVQGMLDGDGEQGEGERGAGTRPRRWRLMLYFHEHTVVSYELGKFGGGGGDGVGEEDGVVGLDELVV